MATKKRESTRSEVVRVYGPQIGGLLEEAKILTVEAAKSASDERMLAIDGIDEEMLKRIREMEYVAPKAAKAEGEREYWIVNPAGAVHSVTKEHARSLLGRVGYRMAKAEEVEKAKTLKVQRFDRPIAPKWKPEPELVPELE
jgi:hypothetical protein